MRRWPRDTSKRKLADFSIFFAPPLFLFPRVYPTIDKIKRPGFKINGLIQTFSRVYPEKGKHAPVK